MDFGRPQQGERVRLRMRNLYILPTRFGWLWLAGTVLLQVVGVQMQSNGTLLLSFLMLSLFLLTLHLTHFNLQGVELGCGEPAPGFAGTPVAYPIQLRCPGRSEGVRLRLAGEAAGGPLSLAAGEHALTVTWTPPGRGWQRPGLLRIQTTAPLGLFCCWSRWYPEAAQLIYPARRAGPVRRLAAGSAPVVGEPALASRQDGSDDWRDLAPHRPQDSPSRLAWKLLAQGRGEYAKRFLDHPEAAPLLAPEPGVPLEAALEHLSERIWSWHGRGLSYGLVLNGQTVAPGRGVLHRDRCLAALACCR
ncbi:hypothetical protein [Synechococcus sp. CCY 0621]|uniref:hypothetical protein n=1 Tax=Synechococcus sp. CCY 0621 TaxID=2815603 RepID=UPI001C246874|nr:hypothetical protein [Synechococcus sp. CCY 0621]